MTEIDSSAVVSLLSCELSQNHTNYNASMQYCEISWKGKNIQECKAETDEEKSDTSAVKDQ
jgi:hypothetical protein